MQERLLQKKGKLQKLKPSFWILLGILAFSFFLNFWNIGQNGTGNEYYAACVKKYDAKLAQFLFCQL